jgi:Proprotein convertase P-domain
MTPSRSILLILPLAALAGCSADGPRACSVACSAERACPDGTSCGADGLCHAADEEPGTCSGIDGSVIDGADGGPDDMDASTAEPDSGTDGCSGATSFAGAVDGPIAIPDAPEPGISSSIQADAPCAAARSVRVRVDITHPFRGDVGITLTRPDGTVVSLLAPGDDPTPDVHETFDVTEAGAVATGEWQLDVYDSVSAYTGTLDRWSIGIDEPPP